MLELQTTTQSNPDLKKSLKRGKSKNKIAKVILLLTVS